MTKIKLNDDASTSVTVYFHCNVSIPSNGIASHSISLNNITNSTTRAIVEVKLVHSAFKCRISSYTNNSISKYNYYRAFFSDVKQTIIELTEGAVETQNSKS